MIENFFEILDCKLRICKDFEITRTIYSNSERSQQSLCFFKLFLQVSQIIKIKITIIQIQIGSQKPTGKEINLKKNDYLFDKPKFGISDNTK